jgi:NAD(P)-dependent dehydrogenase (short-subunit alcohol dehydrogenase family)
METYMASGQRLAGKVAIVTGAGTRGPEVGVGQAISTLFARQGAKLLLVDLDRQNAEATLAAIQAEGGEASVFQADVSRNDECQALVGAAVERYGALHILVNNVGITGYGSVVDVKEEVWDKVFEVNLKSMMLTGKYAVPRMIEAGGGSIINIASVDALRGGTWYNIPYAASKGGVITLTKHMAVHHGRDNVRVNCIAPGMIYSSMVSDRVTPELRELRRRAAPLGVEGTAWDVAWAAVFLASDEARWITGVTLPVDAGLLAASPIVSLITPG